MVAGHSASATRAEQPLNIHTRAYALPCLVVVELLELFED